MQTSTKHWLTWIGAYLMVAVSPFVLNVPVVVVFALSVVVSFSLGTWWALTFAAAYPVLFLVFLPLGGSGETGTPAEVALILTLPALGALALGVGLRKLWDRRHRSLG